LTLASDRYSRGRDLRPGQALTEAGQHLSLAVGERPGQVPGAVAGRLPIGGGHDLLAGGFVLSGELEPA
jgi:hypothetical protein